MKQNWIDRARAEPAAAAALAVFVLSAATLCGAWFFEFVLKIPPCPLCLEERIPYHVVIPLSLLVAIAAIVRAPPRLLIVGFIAIIAAVLCNVVLGTYHAGVEWHFWAGPDRLHRAFDRLQYRAARSSTSCSRSMSCVATRRRGVFSAFRSPAITC